MDKQYWTKSLEAAKNFFEGLGVETISAESTDSAEFIKLISNSYRDLNFAFANEISLIGASFSINSRDAIKIANYGYAKALSDDKHLLAGLNVCKGQVTYKAVADVFGHDYVDPLKTL